MPVDAWTMQFPTFDPQIHSEIARGHDYNRYASLGLAIARVIDEEIPGSFAEIGVFRGDTSVIVSRLAPGRRYYLFDTFEGFPDADLEPGVTEDYRFHTTSAFYVSARLSSMPGVVLKPGYVPETFAGLEDERFAFALLDLDLHRPTVASLEFIYPRLSPGGYLFVHDYNSPESNWACKRALDAFLTDKPELIIEVPDTWGSAMFRKL